MPFGLCITPATFQHLVNYIFRDYLDLFIIVYLDDILVFPSSLDLHRNHVKKVLIDFVNTISTQKLRNANSKDGLFNSRDLSFLQMALLWTHKKLLLYWNGLLQRTRKQYNALWGLPTFIGSFIKNFSGIIAPVTQLTKQHILFKWTPEAQVAFEQLKTVHLSP